MLARRNVLLALLVATTPAAVCQTSAREDLAATLRRQDERLLSAVHRGDKTTWDRATTPDFAYVEDGEISPRPEFLAGLIEDGLAPLVIETYSVEKIGDTAIVMHRNGLSERAHAETARSKFLFLETWQLIGGEWKLRLLHVDRLRVEAVAITLTPQLMSAMTGTYRSGPDRYTIRQEGDGLYGLRSGGAEQQLMAETPDVLLVPGNLFLRKLFRFGAQGEITGFIDRSVALDRIWTKESKVP